MRRLTPSHLVKTAAILCPVAFAVAAMRPASVRATPIASATLSGTPNGSNYQYSIVLNDNSPTPGTTATTIGTFWFAWTPGKDFLNTTPLTVTSPAGWQDAITHGGSTDGYAIQWTASTTAADLAAGSSLSGFSFTSADNPSSVSGNSAFYPTTLAATSVAYEGAPFSDAGNTFVGTVTPEPAALGLLGLGCLRLLRRRPSGVQWTTR